MLYSIIISSTSGIVLFQKEFVNAQQASKTKHLGGIITAMLKFSVQKVGLPLSYIELSQIGVSVSSNTGSKLNCVVFHESSDGSEFGKLLSREILAAFQHQYAQELQINAHNEINSLVNAAAATSSSSSSSSSSASSANQGIYSPDHFSEFQLKIPHIIRQAVRPLLDSLQQQRGISLVLLSDSDAGGGGQQESLNSSGGVAYCTQEVDKLAVLANHQALLGAATDIMGAAHDSPNSVLLRSRRNTLILLRVERASLVVLFKNSVDASLCLKQIEKTAELVKKVLVMASNLNT